MKKFFTVMLCVVLGLTALAFIMIAVQAIPVKTNRSNVSSMDVSSVPDENGWSETYPNYEAMTKIETLRKWGFMDFGRVQLTRFNNLEISFIEDGYRMGLNAGGQLEGDEAELLQCILVNQDFKEEEMIKEILGIVQDDPGAKAECIRQLCADGNYSWESREMLILGISIS